MARSKQGLRALSLITAMLLTFQREARAQEQPRNDTAQSIRKEIARSSEDLAEQLAAQFEKWYVNLAGQGTVPRAFTGITRDGQQLTVILDGLPLDHAERRDFLIWLS